MIRKITELIKNKFLYIQTIISRIKLYFTFQITIYLQKYMFFEKKTADNEIMRIFIGSEEGGSEIKKFIKSILLFLFSVFYIFYFFFYFFLALIIFFYIIF